MAGYVNTVQAIVCSELPARVASIFCDFWKLASCDFIPFINLLFDRIILLFFHMCLLRISLPNMCPNMNHFDAVDFSECHSEEVISFFWRSVYKCCAHYLSWYTCTCHFYIVLLNRNSGIFYDLSVVEPVKDDMIMTTHTGKVGNI